VGGATLLPSTSKEKAVFLGEIFGIDGVIVVVVVGVLLFGGAAIPKLAKNLGSAKSEFEKGLKESKASSASADNPTPTAETKAPDTDK
jgi:Sec-independent protein translocase protein TatA